MSATAVPLRPVSKGGITLLWIGLALLIAAGAAWAMTMSNSPSIRLETVKAGAGRFPTDTDVAIIKYTGKLSDGTKFDEGENAPLPVGGVVPGFAQGLKRMQIGGVYKLHIPSELGYGERGAGGVIPPNADLVFDVELQDIKTQEEWQQIMQLQQMMQQQGMGGPGPHGGAGGGR